MADSTVKLYLIAELLDENNYIIEGLSSLLNQRSPTAKTINDFQYQRLEKSKTIKIDRGQLAADVLQRPWNYASIQNDGNSFISYYFIVGYRQLSKETVALDLELDVLNTFYDTFKSKFSSDTFIMRGHVDRFKLLSVSGTTLNLAKIVDRVSEGDSPSFFTDSPNGSAINEGHPEGETQFYLIYRTSEDEDNPRPCIDMASGRDLLIGYTAGVAASYVMNLSDLVENRYYYLIGNFSITFKNTVEELGVEHEEDKVFTSNSVNGFIRFRKVQNDVYGYVIEYLYYDDDMADNNFIDPFGTVAVVTITQAATLYYSGAATSSPSVVTSYSHTSINVGTSTYDYLRPISLLDRTDSRIVKVIETPYCPIGYSVSYVGVGFKYTFNSFFETRSPEGFFRTYDLTKQFPARSIKKTDLSSTFLISVDSSRLSDHETHFLEDPKILNSAYYRLTFFYDSFAYAVKLEDYLPIEGIEAGATFKIDIKYKQSANVSSNLAFDIDAESNSDYYMAFGEDSFSTILAASRNNELTLFSAEYLNYLRNGYNYDKKKQAESVAFGAGMAALQTAASVLSFALSGVTGGVSAAAGVGLAVGAATSAASVAYNAKQGNDQLEQKLKTLRNQSYSVSNIDDLDLFKYYGGNKLRSKVYQVSDTVKAALDSKFRYYGYAVEKFGNPYPTYTNSRYYYNFLQCEPVFKETIKSVPGEFVESITEKLKAGVTIWHARAYFLYVGVFSKEWENFETSILDTL